MKFGTGGMPPKVDVAPGAGKTNPVKKKKTPMLDKYRAQKGC